MSGDRPTSAPRRDAWLVSTQEDFEASARAFVDVVGRLSPDDLALPGLGVWDVRDLVGHTSRALATVEAYLEAGMEPVELDGPVDYFLAALGAPAGSPERAERDAAIAERGRQAGAALGDDPAAAVAELAERVIDLVRRTSPDSPAATAAGSMRLSDYLPTRTLELTVHTLDVCRAVGMAPPAALDGPVASTLVLLAEIAARRPDRVDLLLQLAGRGGGPSAL